MCSSDLYIAWSCKNRSPLIRIPASRGNGTRVELRNPDPSSNPYLVLASCLAAGLDGIKRKIKPPVCVDGNVFKMSKVDRQKAGVEDLPGDLEQAMLEFKNSVFMRKTLGEHIFDRYLEAKSEEWFS